MLSIGIGIILFSIPKIVEQGFYLAERGNPEQLDGGLLPLLLVIGVGIAAYGGVEYWLNRK